MLDSTAWTLAIVVAGPALFALAWALRAFLLESRKDRVPALLYHHFTSEQDRANQELSNYPAAYFCDDTSFDEQMNYLRREGYTTISLDNFVAFQNGTQSLPPKPIILTFDDGFASNYLYAFPILKKYGMKATVFVTVDPNCQNFRKYAKVDRCLTHAEIKEMSGQGISIESHGVTHRYLSALSTDVARWELEESKRYLETLLGKAVKYIAIPSGAYSRAVKRLVRESGYEGAFCMLKGTNSGISDRFALRRLVIGRDFDLEDFRRVLQPRAAFYLRLASSVQNALLTLLGPGGLDALRDRLYGFGLGSLLTRGQLKYFVPCLGVTALFFFVLLVLILQSHF